MTRSVALARFVDYWHALTPTTVDAINGIYTEAAYFRDPFNEVTGIEQHVLDTISHHIDIPMKGTKESLNVSVCAGIILFYF